MNRDLEALIAAVNAEPRVMLPRMVLADWWEEQGEGRLAGIARQQLCEPIRTEMAKWELGGVDAVLGMRKAYGVPMLGVEITDREPWRNPNAAKGLGHGGHAIGPDGWLWLLLSSTSRMEAWVQKHILPRPIFFLLKEGSYEEERILKRYAFPPAGVRLLDTVARVRNQAIADMNQAALAWAEAEAKKANADPVAYEKGWQPGIPLPA